MCVGLIGAMFVWEYLYNFVINYNLDSKMGLDIDEKVRYSVIYWFMM
jgi:hypothetical protein